MVFSGGFGRALQCFSNVMRTAVLRLIVYGNTETRRGAAFMLYRVIDASEIPLLFNAFMESY